MEEAEEEELEAGALSGYESDDEFEDEDEEAYDEDEDEDEEGGGRPKNDPEWQFFDTAKVFVKAGDGGAWVYLYVMCMTIDRLIDQFPPLK